MNFPEALKWAKRELPDEHAPFAASAALSLSVLDLEITPEMVRKRLIARERDHEANAVREWMYAAAEGKAA